MTKSEVTCRCGYTTEHPWVSDSPEYTIWGWLLVCIGISALPDAIRITCHQCHFVFERHTELSKRKRRQYR